MLLNLHKKTWADNLKFSELNLKQADLSKMLDNYTKTVDEEKDLIGKELEMSRVGKLDSKKHLLEICDKYIHDISVYNLLYSIHSFIFNKND